MRAQIHAVEFFDDRGGDYYLISSKFEEDVRIIDQNRRVNHVNYTDIFNLSYPALGLSKKKFEEIIWHVDGIYEEYIESLTF